MLPNKFPFARAILASSIAAYGLVGAAGVWAQETESTEEPAEENLALEEVVVQGMRMSLESAQDIKRNAPTVVDSITAKDLGSFPDKSVAEALQRVAGITVNRFAATSDTAHFSAEPSGVVVRGLNQVRTEFNGRTSFSANSSRGLSWSDVSPELMAGVDTYKNQMAELIEGGIAGTVNMRTRVPFDQEGEKFALTVNSNYSDLSEKVTPEASGLYSTRWETGVGEFGILANLAYSDVETRTEGSQLFRMNRFRNQYGDQDSLHYIPAGVNMRENTYTRERRGGALAFQFQDPGETVLFTSQYNRSEYENAWEEYLVQVSPADLSYGESVYHEIAAQDPIDPGSTVPRPAVGTAPFTFNDQGLFQTGVITTGMGWWGVNASEAVNAAGETFVNPCYEWTPCPAEQRQRGAGMNTATRSNNNQNMTQDFSANLKWNISERVRSQFDVQYVESEVENYDIDIGFNSFANVGLDLRGERPVINLQDPANVNMSPGNWSNPNNYRIEYIQDHVEDSEGDQLALRADFEFDIDNGWMESIKTGVRWAERDQQVRWSTYNWSNVANTWGGGQAHYYNLDQHDPANGEGGQPGFTGYPEGFYEVREFGTSDYHDININQFVFADMSLLQDRQRMANTMSASALGFDITGAQAFWDPICSNVGDRSGEVPGTCFTPAEIADINEETQAAYVQLNFGGSDAEVFGVPYSGNIGVRYVMTTDISAGGIAYPSPSQDLECKPIEPTDEQPNPPIPQTVGCYLQDDPEGQGDIAFMNDGSATSVVEETHHNLLPSLNIKFDLTEEVILRFAASRAMARPDIGNLRNYIGISATLPDTDDINDPLWIKNDAGEIVDADVRYSGGAQNASLEPIEATQFDLALEYYFADVGSLTFTLFQKKFDNYIQFGAQNIEFTNNGVTRTAEIRRPLNGDGAKIKGFELAFQRFFDFLPEPFDGLGMQANYTYIDNRGITNTNVESQEADGGTITDQAPDAIGVGRLEGLSDHAFNLVGMYEKGNVQARLAYSWRDEYMVTAIDCCLSYPVWNDAYGSLDGSIKYSLTDNLDIALQGSNLLDEETVTEQQVTDADAGGLRFPTGRFVNGRTFALGLRFQF